MLLPFAFQFFISTIRRELIMISLSLSFFADHKAEGMDQSWDKGSWVYCWSYVSYVIDGFDCRWPSWCEQGKVSYCQINEDLLSIFFKTILKSTMTLNLLICSVKTEIVFATIALILSYSVSRKMNEHAPVIFWENKHAFLKVICYGNIWLVVEFIFIALWSLVVLRADVVLPFPDQTNFFFPFSSVDIVGTLYPTWLDTSSPGKITAIIYWCAFQVS